MLGNELDELGNALLVAGLAEDALVLAGFKCVRHVSSENGTMKSGDTGRKEASGRRQGSAAGRIDRARRGRQRSRGRCARTRTFVCLEEVNGVFGKGKGALKDKRVLEARVAPEGRRARPRPLLLLPLEPKHGHRGARDCLKAR